MDMRGPAATRRAWAEAGLAVVVWVGLWALTPGLRARGLGSLVSDDGAVTVLVESAVALVVLAGLAVWHQGWTRELLGRSWQRWAYVLPIVLAVALPFHYGMPLPWPVYLAWMAVSVLWQQFVTFGLLLGYVRRVLPPWGAAVAVSVVFWAGHAIWLPGRFGLAQPLAGLGILAMGFIVAGLRTRLGTLHVPLALHLAFYYLFA